MSEPPGKGTNADDLGLQHMRAFLAVVEHQTQLRAARLLRTEQSTIARHVRRVQEHFGGGLFLAGGSGALSSRGMIAERSIRVAMAELERARERLLRDRPVLRIGFIRPMRPLVEMALRAHTKSQFEVRLVELVGEKQARALHRRELDIAISYALPEFASGHDIEESTITVQPFALVIPESAWTRGRVSYAALSNLVYAHSPRHMSEELASAEEQWLKAHGLTPSCRVECALGSEILAYAASGRGYGFLPALWTMTDHTGVVFAPASGFATSAKIAVYSLQYVSELVKDLRESLSATAASALKGFE